MGKQRKSFQTGFLVLAILVTATVHAGTYKLRTGVGYKNPSGGTLSYTNVSVPYSGGYGGSATDSSFVKCTGVITTVYDWVPGTIPNPAPGALTDNDPNNNTIPDPLDTAPTEVISVETCNASYSGKYYINPGGSGSGSCKNGLEFASDDHKDPFYIYEIDWENGIISEILMGYTFNGVSKGTLYSKRAGGDTITLTCSPEAKANVVNGSCTASVSYQSSIIVPTVNLLGTTRFYDPHALKVITGQRINSTVGLTGTGGTVVVGPGGPGGTPGGGGGGTPPAAFGIDPNSYVWSFDGGNIDPFKDYTYGAIGSKKLLLAADYKLDAFNFYTLRGASTKVVCDFKFTLPAEAKFAGGLPDFKAKSKEVESVRPEYKTWDVKDGSVVLLENGTPPRIECAGDADSSNGQQWLNVKYELPAPFTQVGQGAFCQLITANRHMYRTVTNPNAYTHFKNVLNSVEGVDISLPYPFHGAWSLPTQGTGVDSPTQNFSIMPPPQYTGVWYKVSAVDSFSTWAMYKPPPANGQPTTWVPMAQYTWNWAGTAEWNPNTNVTTLSNVTNPVASTRVETFVHPEWTKVSTSPIQFIGVP